MPKFASAIDTQRIPVKGLIPETSGTAPTSPPTGLLWVDTSVTPRVIRVWDGSAWAPINLYAGTTSGTYAAGNDSRITGAAQKSANLSDLANAGTARTNLGLGNSATLDVGTGAGTVAAGNDSRITGAAQKASNLSDLADASTARDNLGLGDSAVLDVGTGSGTVAAGDDSRITGAAQKSANLSDLANAGTARTNLGLGTAATTNTGTGATNTILGNDARLTDTRTPTDNTVSTVKLVDGAVTDGKVASANKDGTAGTPSMRTLGTGAQQALAGNTRLDQITAPTAAVDLNGQRITGLAAPTQTSDAARLADVQAAQAGIDNKPSARLVATAQRALTGLAAIDGVTPVAGDRVLLTAQTDPVENGIWVAASGAWARATDTITAGSFWMVEEGTTYGGSQWKVNTPAPITVGTTALTINQWGAAGTTYTGTTNRITVSGAAIDIAATYVGQTSITTLGTITTGTWSGTAIAVNKGGTGATDAATARTNLGVAQKGYAADLPAITAGATVTVTHSLGTQDVITQVREVATQEVIEINVTNSSTSQVSIQSDIAYGAGALRIVVLPVV